MQRAKLFLTRMSACLKLLPCAVSVCRVGVSTSQPTVTMEIQPGQDDMVPLILNAGDSHQHQNLQLSPTSPPLTLSQVKPRLVSC